MVFVLLWLLFISSMEEANANYPVGCEEGAKVGVVVRPYELPKVNLGALTKSRYVLKQLPPLLTTPPLKPSGDLCSCKATIVSPALVPKPAVGLRFDTTSKRLQAAMASSPYMAQPPPPPPSVALPTTNYVAPPPQVALPPSYLTPSLYSFLSPYAGLGAADPVPIPSDPVSLQLALKAQREAVKTLEDALSFGFRSLPIDGTMKQGTALKITVPEEKLLAVNGAVVALDGARTQVAKKPTLGEIGFAPAHIAGAPTVTLPAAGQSAAALPLAGGSSVVHTAVPATYGVPGAPSLPCNEIYPGQVQMGTAPKPEKYVLPSPGLPPCDGASE